jgi:hypothetical protein
MKTRKEIENHIQILNTQAKEILSKGMLFNIEQMNLLEEIHSEIERFTTLLSEVEDGD